MDWSIIYLVFYIVSICAVAHLAGRERYEHGRQRGYREGVQHGRRDAEAKQADQGALLRLLDRVDGSRLKMAIESPYDWEVDGL